MTLFVSVWDIPDFYIHCGFPNQETGGNAHSGPYVKTIPASSTGRRGKKKFPAQKKENISYLPVSVGIHDGLSQHVLMCKLAEKYT